MCRFNIRAVTFDFSLQTETLPFPAQTNVEQNAALLVEDFMHSKAFKRTASANNPDGFCSKLGVGLKEYETKCTLNGHFKNI